MYILVGVKASVPTQLRTSKSLVEPLGSLTWIDTHNGNHSGDFAFGCVTAHIWAASTIDAGFIDFSWSGRDEFDEVHGVGDAELQPDGSSYGEISFNNGDE